MPTAGTTCSATPHRTIRGTDSSIASTVKVNRPGVTVVARRGYPAPSRAMTPEERKQDALNRWAQDRRRGGAHDTSIELRGALNRAVQQTGLTIAAQAVAFKGPLGKPPSVALIVEVKGSDLRVHRAAQRLARRHD